MTQMVKSILTATALFFVDVFLLDQNMIAAITVLVIIFWLLPKACILKFKKQSPNNPLMKAAIYSIMVLAIFTMAFANNKIAQYRAENLITVIEKYHQSTGKYPDNLSDLVPEYIPAVPIAKYTLNFYYFMYINTQDVVLLYYTKYPPFGRPTYSFKEKSWGFSD